MKEVKVNDSLLKTEKNEYKQKRESFFSPTFSTFTEHKSQILLVLSNKHCFLLLLYNYILKINIRKL